MAERFDNTARSESRINGHVWSEIERTNAKLRHFRGVSASVLSDALSLWEEIWEVCQDPRTCEEILEGVEAAEGRVPTCGWAEFMAKLNLLRHYLDYTKRLCDGSV